MTTTIRARFTRKPCNLDEVLAQQRLQRTA